MATAGKGTYTLTVLSASGVVSNLPFLDFLEALTRCAEIKAVPTRAEFAPHGESVVTQLLREPLGGNSRTLFCAVLAARQRAAAARARRCRT